MENNLDEIMKEKETLIMEIDSQRMKNEKLMAKIEQLQENNEMNYQEFQRELKLQQEYS